MCDVCGATVGHKAGCPEAQGREAETIGFCELCGEGITEEDDRYNFGGSMYHADCFNDDYLTKGE